VLSILRGLGVSQIPGLFEGPGCPLCP